MLTWTIISWITGALLVVDQLRRPESAWAAADRNRAYWVTVSALLGLMALGLAVAAAYVVLVVPRFAERDAVHDAFRKRA
jgi:hypothetical protein